MGGRILYIFYSAVIVLISDGGQWQWSLLSIHICANWCKIVGRAFGKRWKKAEMVLLEEGEQGLICI